MSDPQLPPSGTVANSAEDLIAGGKVMSIWDHLSELRSRVTRALLTVFVSFGLALAFVDPIINILKQPLLAVLPAGSKGLHFTGPLDVFMVDMKVAFLVGVVCACPFWLYQFWKFFEPALYPRERRFILLLFDSSAFAEISNRSGNGSRRTLDYHQGLRLATNRADFWLRGSV